MTPTRPWTSSAAPVADPPVGVEPGQLPAHQVPLVQELPVGQLEPVEPEPGRVAEEDRLAGRSLDVAPAPSPARGRCCGR